MGWSSWYWLPRWSRPDLAQGLDLRELGPHCLDDLPDVLVHDLAPVDERDAFLGGIPIELPGELEAKPMAAHVGAHHDVVDVERVLAVRMEIDEGHCACR